MADTDAQEVEVRQGPDQGLNSDERLQPQVDPSDDSDNDSQDSRVDSRLNLQSNSGILPVMAVGGGQQLLQQFVADVEREVEGIHGSERQVPLITHEHHHHSYFRNHRYKFQDNSRHYHLNHVHHHHYHHHHHHYYNPTSNYNGWNGIGNVQILRHDPSGRTRTQRSSQNQQQEHHSSAAGAEGSLQGRCYRGKVTPIFSIIIIWVLSTYCC